MAYGGGLDVRERAVPRACHDTGHKMRRVAILVEDQMRPLPARKVVARLMAQGWSAAEEPAVVDSESL